MKASLGEHPNVYRTCIAILDLKGWEIKIIPGPYEKCDALLDSFKATRRERIIFAKDPISLLGVSALDVQMQSNWWAINPNEVTEKCISYLENENWKVEFKGQLYQGFRNQTHIYANNPSSLLGLSCIDNFKQPHGEDAYWWVVDDNGLQEALEDRALEVSFFVYKKEHPEACAKLIKNAIYESKIDPKIKAFERIGISEKAFLKLLKEEK